MKKSTAELKISVKARVSRLMDLPGVGLVVAARTLNDVGYIARFDDRNRFASWTGTAPLDAHSGEQNRHRLARARNRRMNDMTRIAAISQTASTLRAGPTFQVSLGRQTTYPQSTRRRPRAARLGLSSPSSPSSPDSEPPKHNRPMAS